MTKVTIGQKVKIPAGTAIGMGRLSADVVGEIDAERIDDRGASVYGVSFNDPRTKKRRHTWLSGSEIVPVVAKNRRRTSKRRGAAKPNRRRRRTSRR